MSPITITELTNPEKQFVYHKGMLLPAEDVRCVDDDIILRDVDDPLDYSLKSILASTQSLLFPDETPYSVARYAEEFGIYIGHVSDKDSSTKGYMALGQGVLYRKNEEPSRVAILETLTHGVNPRVVRAVIDTVITCDAFEIDPEAVLHFTPMSKENPKSIIGESLAKIVSKATGKQRAASCVVGDTVELQLDSTMTNAAYGRLESLQAYSERIG